MAINQTILSVAAMLHMTEIRPNYGTVCYHDGRPLANVVLAELGSSDCYAGAQVHVEEVCGGASGASGLNKRSVAWDLMVEVEMPPEFEGRPSIKFQMAPMVASLLVDALNRALRHNDTLEPNLQEYATALGDLRLKLALDDPQDDVFGPEGHLGIPIK